MTMRTAGFLPFHFTCAESSPRAVSQGIFHDLPLPTSFQLYQLNREAQMFFFWSKPEATRSQLRELPPVIPSLTRIGTKPSASARVRKLAIFQLQHPLGRRLRWLWSIVMHAYRSVYHIHVHSTTHIFIHTIECASCLASGDIPSALDKQ